MLARDDAIQFTSKFHDSRNSGIGFLQHAVVIGVHWNVGVHIAVARMHMQRHPDATLQNFLVNGFGALDDGSEGSAVEDLFERDEDFALPRDAKTIVLQYREHCVGRMKAIT